MSARTARTMKKSNEVKGVSEKMARWSRQKNSTGIDWSSVDRLLLVKALHCLLASDAAVMIAPAAGGTGVMLKVYEGGEAHAEFAMSWEDLNMLLQGVIVAFASTSEDLEQVFASPLNGATPER